ncbi:hypothetical protein V8C35DRAFT_180110 [Trichoderma chlorosporum]
MSGTSIKGRLKGFFRRRSKSPGASSSSTANASFISVNSILLRDEPSLQPVSSLQTGASSSSLHSTASVIDNPAYQISENLSNSHFLSPLSTSRPPTSLVPARPSASSPPSITISPSVPATQETLLFPVTEEISSVPTSEITPPTPIPPLNLWSEVFDRVNDETKKWIRDHGLNSTEESQPKDQIKELTALLKSKTLSEEKEKPLKIEIGNQKIIVREYVADVVAFLTMAGDIAMTFASPQASAPWAAAKALLKIPVRQIEQMVALAGTTKWLTRIVRRGQVYELIYNATNTDEQALSILHDALRDLYIAAMELLARSDVLFRSGMAKQALNAILRPEQASGLVSDLLKKEQKILLEVQGCEASRNAKAGMKLDQKTSDVLKTLDGMSTPLTRIDEGVAKLLEEVDRDRLEILMDFISSEQFGKGHATIMDARTDKTGDWLINHQGFQDWQAIPSSSTLLCLKGTVGTGKTFLTSRVIEHVKSTLEASTHDEGFAFFYCNRSGPSMQDPLTVLRSFVRQLSYKAYNYDRIQTKVIQMCEIAKREGRDISYKDCTELILDSLNLYSRTTIILDALDESDVMSYNLAEILVDLVAKATKPVKVFISSRPGREYLEAFETESTITVDSGSQQGDIEKYLDEALYSTKFFKKRQRDTQELIKETFASRNGGMFRWVYLQVRRLKSCTSDDAVKLWAKTIPPNLMEAYDQLWNNIKDQHNVHDIALAERAIKWVLCSLKPLKSEFLLKAIRYAFEGDVLVQKEQQSEQQILDLCQDLLTIDGEKQVWMLPHASVAEYFESKDLILGKCDVFVATTSLVFLMQFEWKFLQGRDHTTFEEYVALQWFKHVGRYDKWLGSTKSTNLDAQLVLTLKRFLGSPNKSSDYYIKWVDKIYPGDYFKKKYLMPSSMPLFAICRYGFYYVLRDWWEKDKITKEMVMKENERGQNSLVLAVQGESMHICRYVLPMVDISNHLTKEHIQVMKAALRTRNRDIISLLVEEGKANVNSHSTLADGRLEDIVFPVQWYTVRDPDLLQWFVDRGWINVNKIGGEYGNILIAAVIGSKTQSVEILLKAGAEVNILVERGNYGSALSAAAEKSADSPIEATEMLRMLVNKGADPSLPLKVGGYGSALEAMMGAIGMRFDSRDVSYYKDWLGIMLKAGADPAMICARGKQGSALAVAACYGLKDLLAIMIGVTGKDRAIQCLRQSRHPIKMAFDLPQNEMEIWKRRAQETIVYLSQQIGVDKETLYTIGLWQVKPEEVGRVDRWHFIYN